MKLISWTLLIDFMYWFRLHLLSWKQCVLHLFLRTSAGITWDINACYSRCRNHYQTVNIPIGYHKNATPLLWLVWLLWSVFKYLLINRDWESNFRKYCDSTRLVLQKRVYCSPQGEWNFCKGRWKKRGEWRVNEFSVTKCFYHLILLPLPKSHQQSWIK